MPRSTSSGAPARPAGGLRVTILTEAILPSAVARTASRPSSAPVGTMMRAPVCARPLDQVHVVDQRADGQRHEDAAALDGGRRDRGEMVRTAGTRRPRRQTSASAARSMSAGCDLKLAVARRALAWSRAEAPANRCRARARVDGARHRQADGAQPGDAEFQVSAIRSVHTGVHNFPIYIELLNKHSP